MQDGFFISFEGIEGSGKSTQMALLARYFNQERIPFAQTKEPGGTDLGQLIRNILLDVKTKFHSPLSELLLFYVDRLENVETRIKPALSEGKIVLCDRYIDSSFAYQLGARKMSQQLIDDLNKRVDLMPDLTLLYDIDPLEGLSRAKKRSSQDRFEQETLDFHTAVRQAYLAQAKKEPDRIQVIAVQKLNPDEVFKETLSIVKSKIKNRFAHQGSGVK